MSALLPTLEIDHGQAPSHAVIWLHGLGADGADFAPAVPALGLAATPGVRFVFPNAPEIAVTCNGGWRMPAWYDILAMHRDRRVIDVDGLRASCDAVRRLIAREGERGIPPENVFLAGFSQGGAVAYTTALTHPQRLGGVIALSTYIPDFDLVDRERRPENAALPCFVAHGTADDVVAPALGQRARDWLLAHEHPVTWREFAIDHSVSIGEFRAVGAWLRERIAG